MTKKGTSKYEKRGSSPGNLKYHAAKEAGLCPTCLKPHKGQYVNCDSCREAKRNAHSQKLYYSARGRAPKTNIVPVKNGCAHHWTIAEAQGRTSEGVCQKCGAVQDHENSIEMLPTAVWSARYGAASFGIQTFVDHKLRGDIIRAENIL